MSHVTFGSVRVMGRGLVFAGFVVPGCFMVVLSSRFMVVRRLLVVFCTFMIRHHTFSIQVPPTPVGETH
jgi:hypothetical protein